MTHPVTPITLNFPFGRDYIREFEQYDFDPDGTPVPMLLDEYAPVGVYFALSDYSIPVLSLETPEDSQEGVITQLPYGYAIRLSASNITTLSQALNRGRQRNGRWWVNFEAYGDIVTLAAGAFTVAGSIGENPTVVPVDQEALAVFRVINQYRESEKMLAFIRSMVGTFNDAEETANDILTQMDLDRASGTMLDAIGEIVGAGRNVANAIPRPFFGFDGYPSSETFGELLGVERGAQFRNIGEGFADSATLTDTDYRRVIKAKIVKNNSRGTTDDLILAIKEITPVQFTVTETAMTVTVTFAEDIGTVTYSLIANNDILPRPNGVRHIYVNGA